MNLPQNLDSFDFDQYDDVVGEMLPARRDFLGNIQGDSSADTNHNENAKGITREATPKQLREYFERVFSAQKAA